MYFHRANKAKPGQQVCLDGIRKTTEILDCTICNPHINFILTNGSVNIKEEQINKTNLLNRPPIKKQLSSVEMPLTKYTDKETNRLLAQVAKDRKLLITLHSDQQPIAGLHVVYNHLFHFYLILQGFNGLNKARIEARQAISILESQLKFLDKAECLHMNGNSAQKRMTYRSDMYIQSGP